MGNGYNDGSYWNYGNSGNGGIVYQPPPGYLLVQDPRTVNTQQQSQYGNAAQNVQSVQKVQIPARFMESLDEIKPNEVPSDGTMSIFMQTDCKAIYAKQLNGKGTIDTIKYIPEIQSSEETEQGITIDERLNKMESLMDERFSKIEKMLNRKNHYYKRPNQQKQPVSSERSE